MQIGYACNWFDDHHCRALLASLRGAGAEAFFKDRSFSPARKSAPGLDRALARTTTGDVLIVSALAGFVDRPDILALIMRRLRRVGAHLMVLDPVIDTARDPVAAMEAFVDFAVSVNAQSIAARLPPRPRRGAKGRRPLLRPDQIAFARRELDERRKSVTELASDFSVPYLTMWRALRRSDAGADSDQ